MKSHVLMEKISYRFPVTYYSGGNTGTFYCTYFILNVNNIRFANNYSWANYKFKANYSLHKKLKALMYLFLFDFY